MVPVILSGTRIRYLIPFSLFLLVDSQSPHFSYISGRGAVERRVTGNQLRHFRPFSCHQFSLVNSHSAIGRGQPLAISGTQHERSAKNENSHSRRRIRQPSRGDSVDTETNDLGGFCFFLIMALIRGDIKGCS
jgi:hypothetical protein